LLKSLSKKDIKSGVGEILHYFIVEGSPNTKPLMDSYESILDDYTLINPYIIESLGIKKKMIEKDEFDEKQRIIFNYGHTFGHAIETITDYKISHGQAVTLGIDMANYISASLGFIKWDLYVKIHNIIKKNIPSFRMGVDEVEKYIRILSKDKKNIDDSITCILLDDYGDAKVRVIKDKDNMKNLIVKYFRKEDR
jgi:3-dehydroquinate synthase